MVARGGGGPLFAAPHSPPPLSVSCGGIAGMGQSKCSDAPGGHQACGVLRNASGREGGVVLPQNGSKMNRTRATIKALPTPLPPPSPLRMLMGLLVG